MRSTAMTSESRRNVTQVGTAEGPFRTVNKGMLYSSQNRAS